MLDGQTDMCGTRILHAEHPKELMTRWLKQSIPHPISANVDISGLPSVGKFSARDNQFITHQRASQSSASFHPALPQHEVLF